MKNCRQVTNCRGCSSTELSLVFNLGSQPLANRFKLTSDEHEEKYPLEVLLCPKCSLAQLSIVVDPCVLYSDYAYVTDKGKTMTNHLYELCNDFGSSITEKDVLEIGSNDGTFLKLLWVKQAKSIFGFEPCEFLSHLSNSTGAPSISKLFNSETAAAIGRKFDTVFARHVFAHVDDWRDFFKGLETVTHEDSVVHIEVPYLLDQFNGLSFDQIYHEHLSYISTASFEPFVSSAGWYVSEKRRYPIHGGSIVFSVRRKTPEYISQERHSWSSGVFKQWPEKWKEFSDESNKAIAALKHFIETESAKGKTIYGYGASAKSTVFLNAMQLPTGAIKAMCDSTPYKQGKVCPGTSIVVVPESELILAQPDYAVIFAWNFAREIMEKNKDFKGKWIIPIPKLEVL